MVVPSARSTLWLPSARSRVALDTGGDGAFDDGSTAADPATGVVVLDVVLGFGAHPDPAGELSPLIREAMDRRPGRLSVVVSLCGAAGDPQGLDGQAAALRLAGALVTRSCAQAARLALAAAGWGGERR